MIFQISKELYDQLSETEKYIVDFISENEEKIPFLSITNIADKTFSSSATVSRTIQKCGFQGISDLRYRISQQSDNKNTKESPYAINKILDQIYQEATHTIDNLQITSILKTIEYIKSAEKIYLYARGFTVQIAEEFQMYLQLLGYHTILVSDVQWMKQTNKIVTNKDMIFIISNRNSTRALSESARMARRIGTKIVVCCCKSPTELEKYSDILLLGHSEIIMKSKGLISYSYISLMIIIEIIIKYLSS